MPQAPTLDEFHTAVRRLRGVAVHTPLVPLHRFSHTGDILLKPEIHQPVTNFKIRGVFNAVAALDESTRRKGLSTVSAGNTAQALAWSGSYYGVPTRSVMPATAPGTKIEAVKRYGGEPILMPTPEVFRFLDEHLWENEPYAFIHPWTNRDLMIGHGTIGLEIAEDLPGVNTVYVPVGGGGLIGGVGSALKAINPEVRIVAVEPEGCPALHDSLKQGKPATVECNTLCDGVAVPYITDEMFPLLGAVVDEVALVPEHAVRATIKQLALGNRMVVEGSGALSVAAALATPRNRRGRTVCLVTGGSIDTDELVGILTDPEI